MKDKQTEKPLNITPLRLRALRMIQQNPNMVASELVELCEERTVGWAEKPWNGFKKMNGAQAATRWGAAYAQPLIKAGLVDVKYNYYGWGKLKLTKLGQEVARTGVIP